MIQSVHSNYKDMVYLIPISKLDTSILKAWLHKVLVALHNLFVIVSVSTRQPHLQQVSLFPDFCLLVIN